MISQHSLTLPFYIPRICRLWDNWPEYLANYILRRRRPAEYRLRTGFRLIDGTGTLPGTLAEIFVRRQYGSLERLRLQTIVDVGANMGSFVVYAAQCCPAARIYCYEPEPQNFELLTQNIQINRLGERVRAFQCAVASSSGSRDLAVGASPVNSFHIVPESASRQAVHCTTLANIIADHGLQRIDLLKMNCEGAEYEILEGCSDRELDRIAKIRLEYHNLDGHGRSGLTLSRCLEARGYRIERFTRRLHESGFIWASRTRPAPVPVSQPRTI